MESISKILSIYSRNLFFVSKTSSPFETVFYENKRIFFGLIKVLGKDKIKEEEIEEFFSDAIDFSTKDSKQDKEMAQQYVHLLKIMKELLKNIRVYRCGVNHVKVYIVGDTENGHIAGLSTNLLES